MYQKTLLDTSRQIGTLAHYWWECEMRQLLRKTVRKFLKKLTIELPYNAAIPLLGLYLKELKKKKKSSHKDF